MADQNQRRSKGLFEVGGHACDCGRARCVALPRRVSLSALHVYLPPSLGMLLFIPITTGLVLSYPDLSSPPSTPHSANFIQLPCKPNELSRHLVHWPLEAASQAY